MGRHRAYLLGWLLAAGPLTGRAQQAADLAGWLVPGGRWQPDSGRWTLEASFNYVRAQHLRQPFIQVGLAQLGYTWPRSQLALSGTYIAGTVTGQGTVHLAQLHLGQTLTTRRGHPRWQLTLDRLALLPAEYQGRERLPVYRLRTLAGAEPPLGPRLSLLLNTEPFVHRAGEWLAEVRSQAGVRWQAGPHFQVQAIYWNWWAGYEPRRVRWQHTLLLTATGLL